MQRYSPEFLEKNPHLKGKDMEATRIACEKFKFRPVSVMNFAEGTRFTSEKHANQNSPFSHLLRPKAGGTGFALSAMNQQLTHILDVTIAYPGVKDRSMWAFLCGDFSTVKVRVKTIAIDDSLRGDYTMDEGFRASFQTWLNQLWQDKNELLQELYSA
jgi:1-acyl-sn-glycerol-3-phosphate acyltransferase